MTYNLEFLKADIRDELTKLQGLEAEFIRIEAMIDKPPALINDELFVLLDDFRAFRHKFRHATEPPANSTCLSPAP